MAVMNCLVLVLSVDELRANYSGERRHELVGRNRKLSSQVTVEQ